MTITVLVPVTGHVVVAVMYNYFLPLVSSLASISISFARVR